MLLVVLLLISLFISLEMLLRLKITRDYSSDVFDYGDVYKSGLDNWSKGGKLKEGFKGWVTDGYGGKVWWETNSQGFRSEHDYTMYPTKGVLRILSMGDSFTAGYRVGQDETFSYLLEKWLNRNYGKAEVLISNIEDPAKGLYYLSFYGQFFHPHVIVLGLTLGNDLTQSYIGIDPQGAYSISMEGGDIRIERNPFFNINDFIQRLKRYEVPKDCLRDSQSIIRQWKDSFINLTTKSIMLKLIRERINLNRPQAIMSWFGDYSQPKLFDGIHGLGIYLKSYPGEITRAYQRLFTLLQAYKGFCKARGITFIVTLFPQRFQVQQGDWKETVEAYGLDESCFDTMLPNKIIMEFCRENRINCIDPTLQMREVYQRTGRSLYLPRGDMHWNKFGHRAFFEITREEFVKIFQKGVSE